MTFQGAAIGSLAGPTGAVIGAGIGTVGSLGLAALALISHYRSKLEKQKLSNKTPEEKQKLKIQLQQSMIHDLSKNKVDKTQKKRTICFIGPTSVGKSTLYNDLFNLKLATGIGKTTKQTQKIHETEDSVYMDIPGINNNWQFYNEQDVKNFYEVDFCFLIYVGEVSEVRFIGKLLTQMGCKIILVRNQCDKCKGDMTPIDVVLQQDRAQAAEFGIKCQIICSGIGMRDQIRKYV